MTNNAPIAARPFIRRRPCFVATRLAGAWLVSFWFVGLSEFVASPVCAVEPVAGAPVARTPVAGAPVAEEPVAETPVTDARPMPRVVVAGDGKSFAFEPGGQPFVPWGFNYDHDADGRLLEDYWDTRWADVEADFAEMRALGVNVVRVHLQFGKFMIDANTPNAAALERLSQLVKLAERERLYLDLTGLGCYHKRDVPAWYDALSERQRWSAQAVFWQSIARRVAASPAIFCYDLMNEPVVPGGKRAPSEWLGPDFAGKHFVQFITLDQADRPRPEIARQWIEHLSGVIRQVDSTHLITVGLVDWSLDRPGLTSGFVPGDVTKPLDFVAVHLYPEKGQVDAALATLRGFDVGKPIVIEETFPLRCSFDEMATFLMHAREHSTGVISFYWGTPVAELKASGKLNDAILAKWLEQFTRR